MPSAAAIYVRTHVEWARREHHETDSCCTGNLEHHLPRTRSKRGTAGRSVYVTARRQRLAAASEARSWNPDSHYNRVWSGNRRAIVGDHTGDAVDRTDPVEKRRLRVRSGDRDLGDDAHVRAERSRVGSSCPLEARGTMGRDCRRNGRPPFATIARRSVHFGRSKLLLKRSREPAGAPCSKAMRLCGHSRLGASRRALTPLAAVGAPPRWPHQPQLHLDHEVVIVVSHGRPHDLEGANSSIHSGNTGLWALPGHKLVGQEIVLKSLHQHGWYVADVSALAPRVVVFQHASAEDVARRFERPQIP